MLPYFSTRSSCTDQTLEAGALPKGRAGLLSSGIQMRIVIDKGFSKETRRALISFARVGANAISEITGVEKPSYIRIQAMTPQEVSTEIYAPEGGGAGFYDLETGDLKINPALDAWRAVEVLAEEWIHCLRPEWSEAHVRGVAVPQVLRETLGVQRLRRRPGPR